MWISDNWMWLLLGYVSIMTFIAVFLSVLFKCGQDADEISGEYFNKLDKFKENKGRDNIDCG
jgi:hypothetical protein